MSIRERIRIRLMSPEQRREELTKNLAALREELQTEPATREVHDGLEAVESIKEILKLK